MNHNIILTILIFLVLIILYYINQQNDNNQQNANNQQNITETFTTNNTIVNDNEIVNSGKLQHQAINTGNTYVEEEFQANEEGMDTGACYKPNIMNTNNNVDDLDTCFINQMGKVETADDYIYIIKNMRARYKDLLTKSVDNLYGIQGEVTDNLNDVQNELNKYGLETLSKQYYNAIYKHGNFASVKDRLITDDNLTLIDGDVKEKAEVNNM